MSGLAGWTDTGRDLTTESPTLHAMTEALRHRGPDGMGTWLSRHAALGHRALATGLATTGLATGGLPAGQQPAVLDAGGGPVALVYDGQVFNLAEVRRELASVGGRLAAGSDADVLIQAYLRWGDEFAARLNGMFAFAIWDGRSRRLLLGRDRMGVKPLYYYEHRDGILFASEPKGIMASPLFEARLDFSVLPILLQPRLTLPGETPLAGLREVAPAHVVSWSDAGLSARRYWRLTSEPHREPFAETARHVRDLLEDSVSRRVPASGACAAMLSGGVDSTSVAALAMRALQKEQPGRILDTFCVEFDSPSARFESTELRPDVDSPYAAAAAEAIGSRHTTVTASTQELLDTIPAARRARDLPGWGQFDASMYLLFQHMRRASAVALSGEAADEFFGGYPYFFKPGLVARDTFPWLGDGPRLSDYLSPELTAQVDPDKDERARYSQLLSEVPRLDGEDPVNARMREVLFLGMSGPLAVILDRKERMSMSQGLEVRLPFCDHRLVQYVWNVPWSMKCSGGLKGLLKAAMADAVPAIAITRKKSAYPHLQDPGYDRALLREASRIVSDPSSPLAGMFDTPRLNGLIEQAGAGRLRSSLPGGASGAQLFVQLVEVRNWINDYRVSLR